MARYELETKRIFIIGDPWMVEGNFKTLGGAMRAKSYNDKKYGCDVRSRIIEVRTKETRTIIKAKQRLIKRDKEKR